MANVKISELPVAASVLDADSFPLVQGGVTKQVTKAVVFDGPAMTGAPTAPTAAPGTNTTQIATTAFVVQALTGLSALYPVGSIYMNATNSTNPATLLGFGTWAAFGAGRVPVGFDSGNPLFDTAEETGGSANAIVVSHDHTYSATTGNQSADHVHSGTTGGQSATHTHSGTTDSAGAHTHTYDDAYGAFNPGGVNPADDGASTVGAYNYRTPTPSTSSAGAHTHSFTTGAASGDHTHNITTGGVSANHTHSVSGTTAASGSSGTNANYQPYITVYMWKRTA